MTANRLFGHLTVAITLGIAACGGESLTLPSEGEPANIAVFAGDKQNGLVDAELSTPLIVIVTDSKGRPVGGAPVEFDFTQNGAQATPTTAVTGNDGKASTTLTLGTQVGGVSGVARVPVPQGTVPVETTFTATALPANANIIALVSGDNQQAPVNSTLGDPLVVQVTDGFGNPVEGETITWTVTGGGSVSVGSSQTDGNGRTSVQRTLGTEAGTQTTLASAEGLAGSPVTFTHIATPGGASSVIKISGDGQTAAAGSTIAVVVEVRDQNNNLVPSAPVTWVVGQGGGSVTPQSNSTDGTGRASAQWTLGPSSGHNTLNVVSIGATAEFTAEATGGSSGRVEKISGDGQTGTAGTQLGDPLVIQVFDAANNPVANRTVTWFIGAGGGSTSPQTSNTDGQGMANTRWTLGATGTNTVNAVVAGIPGNVTFTATANPGTPSATRSRVSVSPNQIPTGGSSSITVRVRDASNNPIANVAVSVASSVSGDQISPASDNTGEDGIATFTFTSSVAGARTITATAGGVTINETKVITVFRRSSTIQITGDDPDPSTPGQSIHVTFQVTGEGGGTPTGTVTIFSTLESGVGCENVPVSQGACDFPLNAVGLHRLEATYSGDAQFQDASAAGVDHTVAPVTPIDQAPTANNDPSSGNEAAYTTPANTGLTVVPGSGVLVNDTDPDPGTTLTASTSSSTTAMGGTVSLSSDGSFVYTPASGFSGTDTFTYTVSDGQLTSSATVSINVTP